MISYTIPVAGAEIYTIYRALVSRTVMIGDCLVVLNVISILSNIFRRVEREISMILISAMNFRITVILYHVRKRSNRVKTELKPGTEILSCVMFLFAMAERLKTASVISI